VPEQICPICNSPFEMRATDVQHALSHTTQLNGGAFWECSCGLRWRGNPGTTSATGALVLNAHWQEEHGLIATL